MRADTNDPTGLRQVAWRDLLTAHARLVHRIDERLTTAGLLPMDWYDVLLALYEAPGRRLRLNELADRVLFSRSGLTRLVDRVEAQGLLRRERCAEDRRGAYGVLTEQGLTVLRKTWRLYERLIMEEFGRHMTDDDARALHAVLSRLVPAPRRPEPGDPRRR